MRGVDDPSLITPVARLQDQIDARLILFGIALLGIDVFFIGVYSIHALYVSLYNDGARLLGVRWDLSKHRAYAEFFSYLKISLILYFLLSIALIRGRPIYLAFVPIFAFVLAEDVWQIHDFFFHPAYAFKLVVGIPLVAVAVAAAVRSRQADRRNGLLLLAAVAIITLFGLLEAITRIVGRGDFRGADVLLYVIEDGGQQIMLSFSCGLAILIRRDVRDRERASLLARLTANHPR